MIEVRIHKTRQGLAVGTFSATSAKILIAPQVADRVILDGIRTLSLRTDIKDVVTIQGSMLGGDVFSPKDNKVIAEITTYMLDKGTTVRDKFAISEILEDVGAAILFSSDNYRVRFAARCLSENVSMVIQLLAEQLQSPAFQEEDLESLKKRRIGELKKLMEDTRTRAMEVFLKRLYPKEHPNFSIPIQRQVEMTRQVSVDDLKNFHGRNYGRGSLAIVAVGDVDQETFEGAVKENFNGWQQSPLTSNLVNNSKANEIKAPSTKVVTMEDKASVDIVMGHPVGIDRNHIDYRPLMMGHFILGGNFSARLMATVRDESGLTYGIQSTLGGVDNGNDGFWYIWGTFAPELLQQGRDAALEQLRTWIANGVTEDELGSKKTTISGMYKVGLATTRGLTTQILTTIERGKELGYIDEYPDKIRALTLEKVNNAIKKYCDANRVVTVAAGSLTEL